MDENEKNKCYSCGVKFLNKGGVIFKCPNCFDYIFKRCNKCREMGINYICSVCNFEGP